MANISTDTDISPRKGRRIGKGNTAEVFEYADAKALKLFIPGYSENACRHEYSATRFVNALLDIAPRAYEIIHMDDRVGIVYERVAGDTMTVCLARSPRKIIYFAKMMASIHVGIHKPVKEDATGVKEKLADAINKAEALSSDEKQAILAYLDALPDGKSICHFDFHPDNIMISDSRYYVIDWVDSCLGDPRADVARSLILSNYGTVRGLPPPVVLFFTLAKRIIAYCYLKEYIRLTGASRADIHRWELPVAAARLYETIPDAERKILLKLVRKKLNALYVPRKAADA